MTRDLPVLLGAALKEIRLRTTGTQDQWQARTGMSQSWLSACERGKGGWESVRSIAGAVEAVGVDPLELLRLVLAYADEDKDRGELMTLWSGADPDVQKAILMLLRTQVASRAAAR